MAGFTNRGKKCMGNAYFVADATDEPTAFKVALVTTAVAPTCDTNTLSQLTEVTGGTGYTTGGIAVERSATGFDSVVEDDSGDLASFKIKDLVWTASGGSISGISYAVLVDDEATPNVIAYWTVTGGPVTVTTGQTFTLQDCELQLKES
ncbi:hypothetical protein M0R72_07780 [Candidatus Pacearchaeota archaeon]|jgi:hypothetical protein|nr:hypothetical protein [Candidatus Pacearchaeota archaeon]